MVILVTVLITTLGVLSAYFKLADIVAVLIVLAVDSAMIFGSQYFFPDAPTYSYWDQIPLLVWIFSDGPQILVSILTLAPIAYFGGKAGAEIYKLASVLKA